MSVTSDTRRLKQTIHIRQKHISSFRKVEQSSIKDPSKKFISEQGLPVSYYDLLNPLPVLSGRNRHEIKQSTTNVFTDRKYKELVNKIALKSL
jgi:hypothetical protein